MFDIAESDLTFVENTNLLPLDDKGELDFYAVIITEFRFVNPKTVLVKLRHDNYYRSIIKEITFEIQNVFGKIELCNIFEEASYGLSVKRNCNSIQLQMTSLTKDYNILSMNAHKIVVLKCEDIDNNAYPY